MKGRFLFTFIALSAIVLFSNNSFGQLEFPEDKVSWSFSVEQDGCEAYVVAKFTMVDEWHIYAANLPEDAMLLPTTVDFNSSSNFKAKGGIKEPKPHFEHDELTDEDLYYHSGTIKMKRKIEVLSEKDFELTGSFTFQTCDDSHCLPPYQGDFSVKVKGCKKEVEEVKDDEFASIDGDFAKGKDGHDYVQHEGAWIQVPEGNSKEFYKQYLILGGK